MSGSSYRNTLNKNRKPTISLADLALHTLHEIPLHYLLILLVLLLSGVFIAYQTHTRLNQRAKNLIKTATDLKNTAVLPPTLRPAAANTATAVSKAAPPRTLETPAAVPPKTGPSNGSRAKTPGQNPVTPVRQTDIYGKRSRTKKTDTATKHSANLTSPEPATSRTEETPTAPDLTLAPASGVTGVSPLDSSEHLPSRNPRTPEVLEEKSSVLSMGTPSNTATAPPPSEIITRTPIEIHDPLASFLRDIYQKLEAISPTPNTFSLFMGGSMVTKHTRTPEFNPSDVDLYILFPSGTNKKDLIKELLKKFPGTITTPDPSKGTFDTTQVTSTINISDLPKHMDLTFYFPKDPAKYPGSPAPNIEDLMRGNPLNFCSEKIQVINTERAGLAFLLLSTPWEVIQFQRQTPKEDPIEKYKFMQIAFKQLGRFIHHGGDRSLIFPEVFKRLGAYLDSPDCRNPALTMREVMSQSYPRESLLNLAYRQAVINLINSMDSTAPQKAQRPAIAFSGAPPLPPAAGTGSLVIAC